jgi:hypothetical protein
MAGYWTPNIDQIEWKICRSYLVVYMFAKVFLASEQKNSCKGMINRVQ